MTKMELQDALEQEYQAGLSDGKKIYEQKLRDAIAAGRKLIELDGRIWHLQSDVDYLRQMMDRIDSE